MPDQADNLRQLVQEASQQVAGDAEVPLVVVCGGRHGVGTSTLALQLALACQRRKLETLLVDASFPRSSYYLPSRERRRDTLVDVLSGGRTVSEVLQSGPHGLQILPSADLPPALADISSSSWGRVIGQLRSLQAAADLILIDGGAGVPGRMVPLWQMADLVVLVADVEPVCVMEAYAVVKAASGRVVLPHVGILMNRVSGGGDAEGAAARVAAAADRFLNVQVDVLSPIPQLAELAGQTTAPRRLLKDAALKAAFGELAGFAWQRVQRSSPAATDTTLAAAG